MVKIVLFILSTLFVVAGICEFVYIFKMLFYFPGNRVQNYNLVFLKKDSALKQLNFIWQKIRWYGDSFALGIIAVADDLDEYEIAECEEFIKEKNIILCTTTTISSVVHSQGSYFNGIR